MSRGGVIQPAREHYPDRARVHRGGLTRVRAKLMAGVTLAGCGLRPGECGFGPSPVWHGPCWPGVSVIRVGVLACHGADAIRRPDRRRDLLH